MYPAESPTRELMCFRSGARCIWFTRRGMDGGVLLPGAVVRGGLSCADGRRWWFVDSPLRSASTLACEEVLCRLRLTELWRLSLPPPSTGKQFELERRRIDLADELPIPPELWSCSLDAGR